MRRWVWLAVALAGCGSDAGSSGGSAGGGGLRLGTATPATVAYVAAYERLQALVDASPFGTQQLGDPAMYAMSTAMAPTHPDQVSSVYYETPGLADAVGKARDRRPTVARDDDAGQRLASAVATDLTVGFSADGTPDGQRGSPRGYARQAVRTLDAFLLLTAYAGLAERSADGFDRAVASLWDDDGTPRGIGAVIAGADAACGTHFLATAHDALAGARDPFAAALEKDGEPDALDRLVIEEGQSPEYDAAIATVEQALTQGLAEAFVRRLGDGGPLDANAQADLLGAYAALSARVAKKSASADEDIGRRLDTANPAGVDTEAVGAAIRENLEVPPCGM
jgi:hypothetical protein